MLRVRAEELLRLEREPGVDPAPRDPLGGRLDQLLGARMALAGLFVHEQRNRHPPGALARDTPVGAALDHAADTLLAPCGGPLHAFDVTQGVRAQAGALHADEPLRWGAEDDRGLSAPAMRIALAQRFLVPE